MSQNTWVAAGEGSPEICPPICMFVICPPNVPSLEGGTLLLANWAPKGMEYVTSGSHVVILSLASHVTYCPPGHKLSPTTSKAEECQLRDGPMQTQHLLLWGPALSLAPAACCHHSLHCDPGRCMKDRRRSQRPPGTDGACLAVLSYCREGEEGLGTEKEVPHPHPAKAFN